MNKASGGDGIPVELFQILKDDAGKVLHSISSKFGKLPQWPQDRKRSVFIPIPKKGNAKVKLSHNCTHLTHYQVQFSSLAQSCPTLCYRMNRSMPGLPVHYWLPEFTQTHARRVGDAIQQSHPLLSPSPPAPNPSQHQGLFQWVSSSHQVAKVLEFQLQHQSFQWTPRTDLL